MRLKLWYLVPAVLLSFARVDSRGLSRRAGRGRGCHLTFTSLDVDGSIAGRELGLGGGERRKCGDSNNAKHLQIESERQVGREEQHTGVSQSAGAGRHCCQLSRNLSLSTAEITAYAASGMLTSAQRGKGNMGRGGQIAGSLRTAILSTMPVVITLCIY